MSEIRLLPCPFCGGEAEFHRTPIKTNGGWCDSVVVRCKECEARTNRILYDKKKYDIDGEYDEAAKAWNTRIPMEKIVEQLQEKSILVATSKEFWDNPQNREFVQRLYLLIR